MIKIIKGAEPEDWKAFKKKNPRLNYRQLNDSEKGKEVRRSLREQLLKEQKCVCCYCCKRINLDNSLNEHIRPEDFYPKETMDYANIIVSCSDDKKTCGPKKDNNYDEKLFVSPLEEDCEKHFSFAPDGEIIGETDRGEYTIKLLGLDSYKLKRARAAVYQVCQCYDEETVRWYSEVHEDGFEPFIDVIRYWGKAGR